MTLGTRDNALTHIPQIPAGYFSFWGPLPASFVGEAASIVLPLSVAVQRAPFTSTALAGVGNKCWSVGVTRGIIVGRK